LRSQNGPPHNPTLSIFARHDDPIKADPRGESFTFEKGVTKTGGGDGFADVWKRGFFAWEYKKKKRNLEDAHTQRLHWKTRRSRSPVTLIASYSHCLDQCDSKDVRIFSR
jgi:hypothetical protein